MACFTLQAADGTPLTEAAAYGHLELVKYFIEQGGDVMKVAVSVLSFSGLQSYLHIIFSAVATRIWSAPPTTCLHSKTYYGLLKLGQRASDKLPLKLVVSLSCQRWVLKQAMRRPQTKSMLSCQQQLEYYMLCRQDII
jgi:hypothetical protein